MDMPQAPTLETQEIIKHEYFSLKIVFMLAFGVSRVCCASTMCPYEDFQPSPDLCFKTIQENGCITRNIADPVYGSVALTLQLEHFCQMFGGKAGNYATTDSCKMKFPKQ